MTSVVRDYLVITVWECVRLLCFKECSIYALRCSKAAWPLRQLFLSSIYKIHRLIDVRLLNWSKAAAWPGLGWCDFSLAYSEEKAKITLRCIFGFRNHSD